jgi:flagellar hook assembly protein FlgD
MVPARGRVRLAVYDLSGRLVAKLADENRERGKHGAVWNGRSAAGEEVPSGVYFLRLEQAGGVVAQKVVVRR